MRVLLDNDLVAIDAPTFAEALRLAMAYAGARGLSVIGAVADGRTLAPEEIDASGVAPPDVTEARFLACNARELVADALRTCGGSIPAIVQDLGAAGDAIARSEVEAAMTSLGAAIGLWQQVHAGLTRALEAEGLLGASVPGGDEIRARLATAATGLRSLRDAVGVQDWSRVADLLSFDLAEALSATRTAVAAAADRLLPGA